MIVQIIIITIIIIEIAPNINNSNVNKKDNIIIKNMNHNKNYALNILMKIKQNLNINNHYNNTKILI